MYLPLESLLPIKSLLVVGWIQFRAPINSFWRLLAVSNISLIPTTIADVGSFEVMYFGIIHRSYSTYWSCIPVNFTNLTIQGILKILETEWSLRLVLKTRVDRLIFGDAGLNSVPDTLASTSRSSRPCWVRGTTRSVYHVEVTLQSEGR